LWDLLTQNQKKALRLIAETDGEGIYSAERLQQGRFNSGSVLQRALSSLMEKEILSKMAYISFKMPCLKNGFSVYLDAPRILGDILKFKV
jgi:hypothetical protein